MNAWHESGATSSTPAPVDPNYRWYKELSNYHWFVLIVAALGWLFDCLDQQLFILARPAAMRDLLQYLQDPARIETASKTFGDIATSVFIAGWATGGLVFGMLGDRWGRAKTMLLTILIYSLCTGLNALAYSVYDFAFYRFLTGLGVGGEFAVGVSLVAEVMPSRARPYTLGLLQALSAVGNISAALINMGLGLAEGEGLLPTAPWRLMFCIGALPALLSLVIRSRLKEPEAWARRAENTDVIGKQLGSYSELFKNPTWRRHAIFGLMLACSGVIGLWGVGFYAPDLIREVRLKPITESIYQAELDRATEAADTARVGQLTQIRDAIRAGQVNELSDELKTIKKGPDKQINGTLAYYSSITSIAINVGAFVGMFGFGAVAQRFGRKPTFAIALIAAFISTVTVFWTLTEAWQIFILVPIMGFCQLSLFAGYAIYFPELFPTHLRSTGTSFCYNVGRFLAALGPLVKIGLDSFFASSSEPLRYPGMAMCIVFLIGLFALPFLPETKGQPLPE